MREPAAPADALFLGELGLGGEVRPIGGLERRLAEAARLGFTPGVRLRTDRLGKMSGPHARAGSTTSISWCGAIAA
jgi:DNA repair protein RadA/Sms